MPRFPLTLHSLFFSWRFQPHFYRGCCVVILFVVLRASGTTQFAQLHGHVLRLDFSPVAPIFSPEQSVPCSPGISLLRLVEFLEFNLAFVKCSSRVINFSASDGTLFFKYNQVKHQKLKRATPYGVVWLSFCCSIWPSTYAVRGFPG